MAPISQVGYAAKVEKSEPGFKVDAARGVYVPAGGKKRVWAGSWISRDTHIQLCVRNTGSILGAWLHYPTSSGVDDVREAIQGAGPVVGLENQQGQEDAQGDVRP